MIAAVAGTFNVLHDGHKALISKAFELGDFVFIGVTSDKMASETRSDIVPLYLRKRALSEYLNTFSKGYSIIIIEDIYGPEEMDEADILVVSEETVGNAKKINLSRAERGIRPMQIEVISLLGAECGGKISSTDIMRGRYARNGRTDVPDVVVGSGNHVKVAAVRTVMERIYGSVRVTGIDVKTGVSPQPFEDETRTGAINRARNALEDHDLSVGIEAGVFKKEDGLYDYQYCAVLDKEGRITVGTGMGFMYPDSVAELVRGGMTVGDAVHKVYGNTDIGKKQGAIGLLSKGLIDRKALTEQSVTAAMIPRIWEER